MSVEQLQQQAIPTEVPLVFDVLNRVRQIANTQADAIDGKDQAMGAIDLTGSVVFDSVVLLKQDILADSIVSGRDYRLHTSYGEYIKQRQDLSQLRILASNIESADNIQEGLQYFYNGTTKPVETPKIGRKIINHAINAYGAVKTGATDTIKQAAESLAKRAPRMRVIGAIAVAGVVLAGSLSVQHDAAPKARQIHPIVRVEDAPANVASPAALTEMAPMPEIKQIIVQPGDNLSIIAQRNNSDIGTIFNSNRDSINDPALVYPGQVLKVPVGRVALLDIYHAQELVNSKPTPITETTVVRATAESKPVVTKPEVTSTTIAKPNSSISFDNIPNIHGVDKELIKDVVAYLIHQQGLTPKGAAYLTGNFITESMLNPREQGGKLAQWSSERMKDVPDDLYGQIDFALNIEMDRDGLASDLDELLRSPNATAAQIQDGLRRWERWGIQGNRFEFAQIILSALHS